jgi:hypothetical protein
VQNAISSRVLLCWMPHFYCYVECHYTECRYAECHCAKKILLAVIRKTFHLKWRKTATRESFMVLWHSVEWHPTVSQITFNRMTESRMVHSWIALGRMKLSRMTLSRIASCVKRHSRIPTSTRISWWSLLTYYSATRHSDYLILIHVIPMIIFCWVSFGWMTL